jgi:hypothetical protein
MLRAYIILVSLAVFLGGAVIFASAGVLEWGAPLDLLDIKRDILMTIRKQFPKATLNLDELTQIFFGAGSFVMFLGLLSTLAAATAKRFLLFTHGVLFGLVVLANAGYFVYDMIETAKTTQMSFIAGYITLNCLLLVIEFVAVAATFWVAALVKKKQREMRINQSKYSRKILATDNHYDEVVEMQVSRKYEVSLTFFILNLQSSKAYFSQFNLRIRPVMTLIMNKLVTSLVPE